MPRSSIEVFLPKNLDTSSQDPLQQAMDELQPQSTILTENSSSNYQARVEQLQKSAASSLKLPVTEAAPVPIDADKTAHEVYQLQLDLIASLITAANNRDDNAVTDLTSRGLVSADAHSPTGETALLAAVRAGSVSTVRGLIALGATVDLPGRSPVANTQAKRTPFQVACILGNVALVKLLVEEYRANDSWMAPDGALARQLAEENGHRGIAAYLSGQREAAPAPQAPQEVKEMNKAIQVPLAIIVMFVYIIPRRIFYDFPKAVWQRWRHRIKSNGTPGERAGIGLCEALLHIALLIVAVVFELPRQAFLWIKKKMVGSKKSTSGVEQV